MDLLVKALVFILILSVLVIVHELGHYIMAKKFGMKVEEFGFGFPPKVWGKKKGETEYTLNLLPIGGFVRIYGEDEAGGGSMASPKDLPKKDLDRAFFTHPVWERALVVFAGVVMNTLLAIGIFYAYFAYTNFRTVLPCIPHVQPAFAFANVKAECSVLVTTVQSDSPAAQVGMRAPAEILKLSGNDVFDVDKFAQAIKQEGGKSVEITWRERNTGQVYTKTVVPRKNPAPDKGALGVGLSLQYILISYDTLPQKILSGIVYPFQIMIFQLQAMGNFVADAVGGNFTPLAQNVSGPVGIGKVVGEAVSLPDVQDRIIALLNIAGLLSISLAFFNVLPIPALDGGRLFFILLEGITHRKVSPKVEGYIHQVGFVVLMGLIILITFKDITSLFSK